MPNTETKDEELTDEELSLVADATEADTPMSETTIKRAAALAAGGASKYKVAKGLNLSHYFVAKIWRDELFKKLVAEIGDDAVAASKATMRNELSKLSGLAIKAIEHQLKKHNLNAAITVLRSVGVETAPKDDGADKGGFTLVLAGQNGAADKTVKVSGKGEETDA